MVPDATFTSYYGRPVVKPSPWKHDIPAYLFLGGLAAGSSLLAAGADLTGRHELRRVARLGALVSVTAGTAALIHDLGKPSRFLNMLRVAKPTSPMSVGTWILTAFGPMAGIAATAELVPMLPRPLQRLARPITLAARPAGVAAALLAPALASYSGVLLADTATPAWHAAHRELPFVFAGSAAMAAGGLGMILASLGEAAPARRLAVGGVLLEFVAERRLMGSVGISAEAFRTGHARVLLRGSGALATGGLVGTVAFGRRSRRWSLLSGGALVAASALSRFGIFEAGQQSARDPRYTVAPQRERIDGRIGR
jgi:Polysulphide reductase, NrfD